MQRIKDYAGFGVWFLGLGYIATLVLNGPLAGPVAAVSLSPPLHLVGTLAAIAVFVRLLLIALRSTRGSPADAPPRRRLRRPAPTVHRVKSRDHFGLRGL